ncbi:hypothetical protein WN944_022295 [Citrus x changshan-huyou]|uniref:Uncharacterized protein n=1 Tax=Citrus x changshan-huyou TaxID=2935761 RepID=A0AAP0R151_9ROSI
MGSSKKWAAFISSIASSLYFCFIVFQIPLFRIPCRSGKCTTPIEVTCFQLIIGEVFPEFVAKVLLYPGALASAIMKGKSIPSYSGSHTDCGEPMEKLDFSREIRRVCVAMELKEAKLKPFQARVL